MFQSALLDQEISGDSCAGCGVLWRQRENGGRKVPVDCQTSEPGAGMCTGNAKEEKALGVVLQEAPAETQSNLREKHSLRNTAKGLGNDPGSSLGNNQGLIPGE